MAIVVGSDNGLTGSTVFLDTETKKIVHIENCSTNAKRLYELLQTYKPVYAATEEVFMSPGFRGVASVGFQVMGRYMQTFELLDIPYETIRAVSWRAALGIKAKGRDNQKEAAIVRCMDMFDLEDQEKLKTPWRHLVNRHYVTEIVFDNNKCESALIAYYALCAYNRKRLEESLKNDNEG